MIIRVNKCKYVKVNVLCKKMNLKKITKRTEMSVQLAAGGTGILLSVGNFLTSVYGKCLTLMAFFASLGLSSIAPLIHLIILFTFLDMLFGIGVTIKLKGISHILSSRLRDSLIKIFFYLIIIIGLFLIESVLIVDGYILTTKIAFAIIAGTELWSILSNMLILMPNIPVLKLLKNVLIQEIAKKTGVSEEQIVKDLTPSK